jgi:hypothetical protein
MAGIVVDGHEAAPTGGEALAKPEDAHRRRSLLPGTGLPARKSLL